MLFLSKLHPEPLHFGEKPDISKFDLSEPPGIFKVSQDDHYREVKRTCCLSCVCFALITVKSERETVIYN